MAEDLKSHVELHPCIEWTIEMPAEDKFKCSEDFSIGDASYKLRVDNLKTCITLALYTVNQLPSPILVTAFLSSGTEFFMPQMTTVKLEGEDDYDDIWTAKECEVSKFLSDSDKRHTCCFRVVFHASRSGQELQVDKSTQTALYWDTNFKFESFSRDIIKMLYGSSSTDIELKCGDKTFQAHRSLLSCRSEVFKAMLGNDMVEGNTGQVVIPDIEEDLFEHFLQYLYSGKLPELSVDSALRFYEIGDMYAVADIKDECREFLSEHLALDNACLILKLADRHSDKDFRKCVMEYILKKEIPLCHVYWSDFCNENPQLANEIYALFVPLIYTRK